MEKLIFAAIIATVMIPLSGLSQDLTGGWKGIKVFKSTRADVERALGQRATVTDGFRSSFVTDEAIIHVLFSGEPCSSEEPYTGTIIVKTATLARAFDVPRDTVIMYDVNFKEGPLFADLKLGKEQFQREVHSHMPQFVDYFSDDNSITITTVALRKEAEKVRSIVFGPAAREQAKFACNVKKGRKL